jgi:hypothetical protein
MATHAFPPPTQVDRPKVRDWLIGSFWIADVMLLAVLTFFLLVAEVNPFETAGLTILFGVMLGLFVARMALNRRDRDAARTRAMLMDRERRGF